MHALCLDPRRDRHNKDVDMGFLSSKRGIKNGRNADSLAYFLACFLYLVDSGDDEVASMDSDDKS